MGLKSMHEAKKPQTEQKNSSTELLEQQSKRITELEQQVQTLSSENSTLRSELQKKSEKIEKLNEADLVLKQNAELQKQNSKLLSEKQQAEERAEATVTSVKSEYRRKETQLYTLQQQAREAERTAQQLADERESEIKSRVSEKSDEIRKSLEMKYQGKLGGALLYGLLATVLTASQSEAFVLDFKAFFLGIWNFLSLAWETLLKLASGASQIAYKIPQETVAVILHWVILAVIVVGAIALVGFLLFIAVAKLYSFYTEYDYVGFADQFSLAELLISLAVIVWFAEPIRTALPVNLLLLFILAHVVFIAIRWYIKKRRGY